MSRLPVPLTGADQAAGYWWELSMRQVEVSRTVVFAAPRHARAFFEALVTDNLGMGRPDEISLIFDRRVQWTASSSTPTSRWGIHQVGSGPGGDACTTAVTTSWTART